MTEPYMITYDNGKMIITHPTGVVNEYDYAHILDIRNRLEKDIGDSNLELAVFDEHLTRITESEIDVKKI